jgi:hypothetical protein
MREPRVISEINIDGDLFLIDVPNHQLRQVAHEDNCIPFHAMNSVKDGFEFEYSPADRNIFTGTEHQRYWEAHGTFTVKLQPTTYIPEHVFFHDHYLKEIVDAMRKLPEVDIGGTMFYVDSKLQEFRQVDNLFNAIEFHECLENEKGLQLQFDLAKKTIFHGTPEEAKQRKDQIMAVKLKPLYQLDPLGWIERKGQANDQRQQMRRSR